MNNWQSPNLNQDASYNELCTIGICTVSRIGSGGISQSAWWRHDDDDARFCVSS